MAKKLFAAICASAMALAACTACGGDSTADSSSAPETTAAVTTTTTAETAQVITTPATEALDIEEAVEAKSGDAILAIADGQWWVQYWGTTDDILTYDAGVATIDGDGDYTVSVNVATTGAQYDITDGQGPFEGYECESLSFAAIKVFDGTKLYPNMSIEIKEIRVDGKAIEMTAKNYTSSDDGEEMRANIYNSYVSSFPDDAHTADGPVTGEFGEYSSMVLSLDDVAKWSKIEVDFTVTGTGAEGGSEEGGDTTDAAEETTEAAEETTTAAAE